MVSLVADVVECEEEGLSKRETYVARTEGLHKFAFGTLLVVAVIFVVVVVTDNGIYRYAEALKSTLYAREGFCCIPHHITGDKYCCCVCGK